MIAHSRPSRQITPGSHTNSTRATWPIVTGRPEAVGMFVSFSAVMVERSLAGWRTTMSISSLVSRNWPMVVPDNTVLTARRTPCEVTPSARSLSWSRSRRSTFTDSFQLSLTPTAFGFARSTSLTWSATPRTMPMSGPATWNCTGYGTGGPFGSSFTRPRTSGKSLRKAVSMAIRTRSRASASTGSTTSCDTFDCGKIWSSGR